MRMLSIYDSTTTEKRNNNIREALGQETTDTKADEVDPSNPETCPNCRESNIYDSNCPKCGVPVLPTEKLPQTPLWLQTYYDVTPDDDCLANYFRQTSPDDIADLGYESWMEVLSTVQRELYRSMGTGQPLPRAEAAERYCALFDEEGIFKQHYHGNEPEHEIRADPDNQFGVSSWWNALPDIAEALGEDAFDAATESLIDALNDGRKSHMLAAVYLDDAEHVPSASDDSRQAHNGGGVEADD
jgi:hypothetical protein